MAASRGRPSPDRHRRRARAAVLRPLGRRLRLTDRRRLRVRDLGSPAPPALLRPRSARDPAVLLLRPRPDLHVEIGRASCRESVDLGGRRIIKKKKRKKTTARNVAECTYSNAGKEWTTRGR